MGSDPASGSITLVAGGGDAWGAADGIYFAWQPLTGDGSIVAHLSSVQKAVSWSRAGVMIRESLAPGSPNAFMFLSAGSLTGFQRRRAAGAATFATVLSSTASAPGWVRLDRAGDVVTAYLSADGVKWTFAGSDTVSMAATVYVGLAGTSASITATSTSTFDSVSLAPGTPAAPLDPPVLPPLPDGWARADVGNVGLTGDTSFDLSTSTFTMKGAGTDIWGSADASASRSTPGRRTSSWA